MKLALLATIIASICLETAAIPVDNNARALPKQLRDQCRIGQPCWPVARSPVNPQPDCRIGAPCGKVNPVFDTDSESPEPVVKRWCRHPGMGCYKNQRSDDGVDKPNFDEPDFEHDLQPVVKRWCRRPGMGCYKNKRSEEGFDEPDFDELDSEEDRGNLDFDYDDSESIKPVVKRWCRRPGMGCFKNKRSDNGVDEPNFDEPDSDNEVTVEVEADLLR
ncbi:hypothetical protein FQN54_000668 [Arachnomyces sp. PD_36]|nr:hypothetical protein FQN54_000668 [Arachnomyces sp. PD_36]